MTAVWQVNVAPQDSIVVQLPPGTTPEQKLTAVAPDGRAIVFQAPPNAEPGMRITVAIPAQPARQNEFDVRVPDDYVPGQELCIIVENTQFQLRAPDGTQPGATIRVALPPPQSPPPQPPPPPRRRTETLTFVVPEGHVDGTPLHVVGPSGEQLAVNLPPGSRPGTTLQLPPELPASDDTPPEAMPEGGPAGGPAAAPALPRIETLSFRVPDSHVEGTPLLVRGPSGQQLQVCVRSPSATAPHRGVARAPSGAIPCNGQVTVR